MTRKERNAKKKFYKQCIKDVLLGINAEYCGHPSAFSVWNAINSHVLLMGKLI